MSVSLPVIVGAGAVIVALLCIGVTARRRRLHADAAASDSEPVEAVFVDDMPAVLESFVPSVEPPHSEPARAAHAHVYPVHKLQQAGAEAPITFGPARRESLAESLAESSAESLGGPETPIVVREPVRPSAPPLPAEPLDVPAPSAPKLEVVPEPELPVEQEPIVEIAPVTEAAPTAEVAMLTAQIEVLAETIARLTDRLDAVASVVVASPASQPQAVEPEAEPEPVVLRSVAYEPEAEFALEAECNTDVELDVEPDLVSVTESEPRAEPPRPEPVARADRMSGPPAAPLRATAEPATYTRKRVDDDLLAWPSDEDLERFSSRQGRRDI